MLAYVTSYMRMVPSPPTPCFIKNIHFMFSSFFTQMLTKNFNRSFTAAFSDELQKKRNKISDNRFEVADVVDLVFFAVDLRMHQ